MLQQKTDSACGLMVKDTATSAVRPLPKLRYLRTKEPPRPSIYPLYSIDRALEQAGFRRLPDRMSNPDCLAANIVYKYRWMWNLRRSSSGPVFVSLHGVSRKEDLPFFLLDRGHPVYMGLLAPLLRFLGFVLQAAADPRSRLSPRASPREHFAGLFPKMKIVWLPEATDPTEYCASIPWSERQIDVLEMGRKHEVYHSRIADKLAQANRVHLYERAPGQFIFPGRAELVDGLARTKILICFPRCQTHPEDTGGVETVTYRYFQSMASKCLIVGHAPQELIDLFGYNPVLEVQEGNEFEQIEWVLSNLDSFSALVEQNYARLLEVGTWTSRVETILDVLREHPEL